MSTLHISDVFSGILLCNWASVQVSCDKCMVNLEIKKHEIEIFSKHREVLEKGSCSKDSVKADGGLLQQNAVKTCHINPVLTMTVP